MFEAVVAAVVEQRSAVAAVAAEQQLVPFASVEQTLPELAAVAVVAAAAVAVAAAGFAGWVCMAEEVIWDLPIDFFRTKYQRNSFVYSLDYVISFIC